MGTHNLCFEQKYENTCISDYLSEKFQFLVVKFSIYLNRRVFVMLRFKQILPRFHSCIYGAFSSKTIDIFLFVQENIWAVPCENVSSGICGQ